MRLLLLLLAVAVPLQALKQSSQLPSKSEMEGAALRPFTVADSIEMSHFVDPDEKSADHPQVSPNGNRFFIVLERGVLALNVRAYSLLIYDLTDLNREPVRLITFSSSSNRPGINHAKWVDNESVSLIGENPGQLPQVYLVNCRTHKAAQLTSDQFGVVDYDISHNRRTLAYYAPWAGDEETTKYKELHGFAVSDETLEELANGTWRRPQNTYVMYLMDIASRRLRIVHATPFVLHPTQLEVWLSPDGRYAVTEQGPLSLSATWEQYEENDIRDAVHRSMGHTYKVRLPYPRQMMLVDAETAEMVPLLDAPVATPPSVVWSADSLSVVVFGSFLPLSSKDANESKERRKFPVIAEVSVPSLSYRRVLNVPAGERWTIHGSDDPNMILVGRWIRAKDNTLSTVSPLELRRRASGWSAEGESKTQRPGSNIKVLQTLQSWPKLMKINATTHRESVLLDPNPQLRNLQRGKVEVIHWTGKRGEPLTGGLIYPTNYERGFRYPLVIQTYAFLPELFLLDGPFTSAFAAEELANKGIAVLQISQSPLAEPSEGTQDYGPVNASQVESAIDYLDSNGLINRERVGLVGFSRSGFQVVYALVHSKYHFSAATFVEGNDMSYWKYVAGGNLPYGGFFGEQMYGGLPWTNWKSWMEGSISFNYDKINTPLRIESDMNDSGSVIYEWEKFIALKRLRKPVELVYLSHGDHPVVKPWDRMTSQQGNVDWMAFWLKDEEDTDPAKAEQYLRWRDLRKLQDDALSAH